MPASRAAEQREGRRPLQAGEILDELRVGPLTVMVKHSCFRRDMYDIKLGRPFPAAVRQQLEPLGTVRGGEELFAVDVKGVHQITVAVATGRIVVMPKMATARPDQRRAALALAEDVATLVALAADL